MKTKTQIVFVASIIAILIGALLAIVRLPQKGKGQEVWLNQWDIALWAVAGIVILVLIVFGLRKFGTAPNSWFPPWLKGLVAIAVIVGASLWIYREWESVEKGFWDVKGFADKAITEDIALSSIEGVEIDGKKFDSSPTRYFLVRILPDKDTYWGTCSDGKSFQGIAIINDRVRELFSKEADLTRGNIVVKADNGLVRNGSLVEIKQGSNPRVFLDMRNGKSGCKTDAPLKISIQFIPEKNP